MEAEFNNKRMTNNGFQDPMGKDAHQGLERFLDKFHQPGNPGHTIITDPEYSVHLWFHNAIGNLIECPYACGSGNGQPTTAELVPEVVPVIDPKTGQPTGEMQEVEPTDSEKLEATDAGEGGYRPRLPSLNFDIINKEFSYASSKQGVYGGGKDGVGNKIPSKCLDLTPFVHEATLPEISPANGEKIQTLFGETTAGSFSPYASDGSKSITLNMIDTEYSILDAIFYPWMKDINSPWWYRPSHVFSHWATPYPMATLEVTRPRMRFSTSPSVKNSSRSEGNYQYYSYRFIGVKPTSYASFEINGSGRSSLLRSLTLICDMCVVDLTNDAHIQKGSSINLGTRKGFIFGEMPGGVEYEPDYPEPQKPELDKAKEDLGEVDKDLDQADDPDDLPESETPFVPPGSTDYSPLDRSDFDDPEGDEPDEEMSPSDPEKEKSLLEKAKDKMKDLGKKALDKAKDVAGKVADKVNDMIPDSVKKAAGKAANMVKNGIDKAKEKLSPVVDSAKEKLSNAANAIKEKAQAAVDKVKETTSNVKNSVSKAKDAVKGSASKLLGGITSFFGRDVSGAYGRRRDKMSDIPNTSTTNGQVFSLIGQELAKSLYAEEPLEEGVLNPGLFCALPYFSNRLENYGQVVAESMLRLVDLDNDQSEEDNASYPIDSTSGISDPDIDALQDIQEDEDDTSLNNTTVGVINQISYINGKIAEQTKLIDKLNLAAQDIVNNIGTVGKVATSILKQNSETLSGLGQVVDRMVRSKDEDISTPIEMYAEMVTKLDATNSSMI